MIQTPFPSHELIIGLKGYEWCRFTRRKKQGKRSYNVNYSHKFEIIKFENSLAQFPDGPLPPG